jgi:CrcB protein
MNLFFVFIGGGFGSLARYGTGVLSKRIFDSNFPYGTFISNITSCFILGVLVEWLALRSSHQEPYRLLIAVGFCGGFSTFSSFTLESFEMLRTGNYFAASVNIFGSILICLAALWTGTQAMRHF